MDKKLYDGVEEVKECFMEDACEPCKINVGWPDEGRLGFYYGRLTIQDVSWGIVALGAERKLVKTESIMVLTTPTWTPILGGR